MVEGVGAPEHQRPRTEFVSNEAVYSVLRSRDAAFFQRKQVVLVDHPTLGTVEIFGSRWDICKDGPQIDLVWLKRLDGSGFERQPFKANVASPGCFPKHVAHDPAEPSRCITCTQALLR